MSIRPVKYEIDKTGLNPNNLVLNEDHVLPASGKRFLVTDNGPFYTHSVVLTDMATGQVLAPRTQYTAIQLEEEATLESGKEVCSILIIDDDTVSANVMVTYQCYGGWMSYSVRAILEMIQNLDLDNRVIDWGMIVGAPDRYPPAPHAHPLSDIYGWSKLFPALNAIRDAILRGDEAKFDAIRTSFAAEIARLEGRINANDGILQIHIADHGNPHQVDKAQVGLPLVPNFAMATKLEATAGVLDTRFMSPLRVSDSVNYINDGMLAELSALCQSLTVVFEA
jgi:hypothetical protein